jgi:hypothetical protein
MYAVRIAASLAILFSLLFAPAVARADARRDPDDTSREPEHLRVGALAGVGFPRPLTIEALAKIERTFGLGVEYGVLPTMNIGGVTTRFSALAADARVFPLRGAFFLGVRAGHQHLGTDATIAIPSYGSIAESITVDTWFINPRLGFLWTWEPGLSLGIEAGVQIPVSSSSSSTVPPGIAAADSITSVTNTLGRGVLPTVDLLRLGFLF